MKYYILMIFLSVFYSCNSQNISPEKETYDKLFEKVSNKGKWGNKDKKGTVNYIDNNKILNALKLPEKGISVSLSFNITQDSSQINHSDFDEITKYNHQASSVEFKGYDWATDNYSISYHGFTVSDMDGLAHLGQGGKLYNGYDASNITSQGFEELGIEAFSGGIMSKGVLIDIPLLYGKEYLDAGTKITPQGKEYSSMMTWDSYDNLENIMKHLGGYGVIEGLPFDKFSEIIEWENRYIMRVISSTTN